MREALRRLLDQPIAHRGLHACGAPEGPIENSIGAARAAIAAGYAIECDIQRAADGEAMVFHDDRLERLTAATGAITDMKSEALSVLALGGTGDRIPTLADFLAAIGGRVPVVIEIKSDLAGDRRLADRAMALLSNYAGPAALESFDEAVVAHCLGACAPCPVGLVGPAESGGNDPGLIERCDFVSWSITRLAEVAARHPRVPATTWTVRTAAEQATAKSFGAQIVFEGLRPITAC